MRWNLFVIKVHIFFLVFAKRLAKTSALGVVQVGQKWKDLQPCTLLERMQVLTYVKRPSCTFVSHQVYVSPFCVCLRNIGLSASVYNAKGIWTLLLKNHVSRWRAFS